MVDAIYPGSFDPFTLGHLDIALRARGIFGNLTIAVGVNGGKTSLLTPNERLELINEITPPGINAIAFEGLLADFVRGFEHPVIIKGIRNTADLDGETPMAQMNKTLAGVETVFLPASAEYGHIASSLVKQIARLGGDVSAFVPLSVAEKITSLFDSRTPASGEKNE